MSVRNRFVTPEVLDRIRKAKGVVVHAEMQGWHDAHELPNGGIHYLGTVVKRRSFAIEVHLMLNSNEADGQKKRKVYYSLLLQEYKKGTIIHVHFEPSTMQVPLVLAEEGCKKLATWLEHIVEKYGEVDTDFVPVALEVTEDGEIRNREHSMDSAAPDPRGGDREGYPTPTSFRANEVDSSGE